MKKHVVIILAMLIVMNVIYGLVDLVFGDPIEWMRNFWMVLTFIGLAYLFGGLLNRVYKKDE